MRRELDFASLDEVMPEVERLLAGHATAGRWSLAQVLNHLSLSLRFTIVGTASPSLATRAQEVIRRRFFRLPRFPEDVEVPAPSLLPADGLAAPAEAESLREAMRGFSAHDGPFSAHPALGPLRRGEWTRFHCMHCAHHLGFSVPLRPGDGPRIQDTSNMSEIIRYLDMARAGHREAALHNLVEQGEPVVHRLEESYRREADPAVRALLVEAVWQIRSPSAVAFLGEALRDPVPEVWRQALDGLVTLASHESLQILESARERLGDDGGDFGEWLDGAIEDVSGRINE